MPKVTLKKGLGKHRLGDGTYCEPGQEVEVSEAALANIGDKFEVVPSAAELMVMAERKAEDEASAAKLATSSPAQKLLPSPVNTTTLASEAATSAPADKMASTMAGSRAFILSGRVSVTRAMWS